MADGASSRMAAAGRRCQRAPPSAEPTISNARRTTENHLPKAVFRSVALNALLWLVHRGNATNNTLHFVIKGRFARRPPRIPHRNAARAWLLLLLLLLRTASYILDHLGRHSRPASANLDAGSCTRRAASQPNRRATAAPRRSSSVRSAGVQPKACSVRPSPPTQCRQGSCVDGLGRSERPPFDSSCAARACLRARPLKDRNPNPTFPPSLARDGGPKTDGDSGAAVPSALAVLASLFTEKVASLATAPSTVDPLRT